jgi:hypothetical protein
MPATVTQPRRSPRHAAPPRFLPRLLASLYPETGRYLEPATDEEFAMAVAVLDWPHPVPLQ